MKVVLLTLLVMNVLIDMSLTLNILLVTMYSVNGGATGMMLLNHVFVILVLEHSIMNLNQVVIVLILQKLCTILILYQNLLETLVDLMKVLVLNTNVLNLTILGMMSITALDLVLKELLLMTVLVLLKLLTIILSNLKVGTHGVIVIILNTIMLIIIPMNVYLLILIQ